jgi:hypothetical protein
VELPVVWKTLGFGFTQFATAYSQYGYSRKHSQVEQKVSHFHKKY